MKCPSRIARLEKIVLLFFYLLLPSVPQAFSLETAVTTDPADDAFLEKVARQTFDYFLKEKNADTGLVPDRADNLQPYGRHPVASIAATGFGLTAWGIAAERGWMDKAAAREMARRTLEFARDRVAQEHGFFYHFVDSQTGAKVKGSEVSPIDTALFLAGALFAGEYFQDASLKDAAAKIYERIDFPWMLHGGKTLALSWKPEEGFNKRRWDRFDESILLYLLAMGSPTHPVSAETWRLILRPAGSYRDYRLIQMPPLFTHQYPHAWIDFRDKNDGYADYFKNSVNATLANRAFVIDQAPRFEGYGPDAWGLSATDGPFGYRAYGAPPGWAEHDGTISPSACGASIVFTPKESTACMRNLMEKYPDRLWGRYGFSSAFNPDKNWFSQESIGIDEGALLLMIENARTGLVWDVMNRVEAIRQALQKAGFKNGTMELPWPDPPEYQASYVPTGIQVDGYINDWPKTPVLVLDASSREFGDIQDDKDLSAEFHFAWDDKALYFFAKVTDQAMLLKRSGATIWKDDLIEIYIDPAGDGFLWNNKDDFQIGFRPRQEDDAVVTWSWFRGADPAADGSVEARGYVHQTGYVIEGEIRWSYLGVTPGPDAVVRLSVAVHDVDRDRNEKKLQWFFRNEKAWRRFELGKVRLAQAGSGPNLDSTAKP